MIPSLCALTLAALAPAALQDAAPAQALPRLEQDERERTPPDAPLERYRVELLDLAFRSAAAMPLVPHVKNRARAQEEVVTTCLELDQPLRALAYAERITNWRKGACRADVAFHLAGRGRAAEARALLEGAAEVADEAAREPNEQQWRIDRIRAKIAKTWLLLGEPERARRVSAGLEDSQRGELSRAEAGFVDRDGLDAPLARVDAALGSRQFDQLRAALEACARLHARFHADPEVRALLEAKITEAGETLPPQVRIDLALELAQGAAAHSDRDEALRHVGLARALLDGARWRPEDRVALLARIARLRGRAGDPEGARRDVDAALAAFEDGREEIESLWRAGALRPIAEAYQALGTRAEAARVYALAVEEGAANPNLRPRVADLVSTACSMARTGCEPSEELWERLRAVAAEIASAGAD